MSGIPKHVDLLVYLRRMLVQQIIQLANKTEGGTTSLVEVREYPDCTDLSFEMDYYLQDITATTQVRKFSVRIELDTENVQ